MAETVRSFERGLRVIRSFGNQGAELTLSEVARTAGLNRATARRLLLTLEELGYAQQTAGRFRLTPRVLDLGYAYLSSFAVPQLALVYLEQLSEELGEASSLGVLDETEVVYVARVPANRVMSVSIGLGSRFPAHRTSLGRVLLAALDDDEVTRRWDASDHRDPTPHTVTRLDQLRPLLDDVRARGFALVDQELEVGVRSVAAPVHDATGATIAAINVSTHTSRTSRTDLRRRFAPALLRAAGQIDHALASSPTPTPVR